jgi:hypothetical protein
MIETKQLASSVPSSQQRLSGKSHGQVIKPRVWEFIVHKELEAQKLPDFDAVRVPVPASSHRQVESNPLDQSCSPPAARSPGRHLKVVTGAAWR